MDITIYQYLFLYDKIFFKYYPYNLQNIYLNYCYYLFNLTQYNFINLFKSN